MADVLDNELDSADTDSDVLDREDLDRDDTDGECSEAESPAQQNGPKSLLQELDARQDEVLDELDRLNQRIEKVIAEWGHVRGEKTEVEPLGKAA
jgi:hypothetical protein